MAWFLCEPLTKLMLRARTIRLLGICECQAVMSGNILYINLDCPISKVNYIKFSKKLSKVLLNEIQKYDALGCSKQGNVQRKFGLLQCYQAERNSP